MAVALTIAASLQTPPSIFSSDFKGLTQALIMTNFSDPLFRVNGVIPPFAFLHADSLTKL
jgi:hypothetical protein